MNKHLQTKSEVLERMKVVKQSDFPRGERWASPQRSSAAFGQPSPRAARGGDPLDVADPRVEGPDPPFPLVFDVKR